MPLDPTSSLPSAPGRASLRGRLLNRVLSWTVKPSLARLSMDNLGATRARLNGMSNRLRFPAGVRRQSETLNDVPAEWTHIAGISDPTRTILYCHGGAYLVGSPRMYRDLTYQLARACRAQVVAIDYRLAPEHPFPAAYDDALAAYRALLSKGIAAHRIVIAGDSAGGNLALALLQRLRDLGEPLPAGGVLFSPWADLTLAAESIASAARLDPMLPADRIEEAAHFYAGEMLTSDARISPVFGSFAGLPPQLLHVGTRELLLDSVRRVRAAAERDGVAVEYQEWRHMPHVFHAFARLVPEARAALQQVGRFVIDRISAAEQEQRSAQATSTPARVATQRG